MTTLLGGVALFSEPAAARWLVVQGLSHGFNLLLYLAFRIRMIAPESSWARWWRRSGVLATALGWAYGGHLWSLAGGQQAAWVLLFCYGGVTSGAAVTLAGDARWFPLFGIVAGVPNLMLWATSLWWVSAMITAYIGVMTLAAHRNGAMLQEALALRFENAELLAETLRKHAAAQTVAAERARFLATASHDLRQPVQAVSLFADVVSQGAEVPEKKRERALVALRYSTEVLREMLESLLDISRLDSGVVEVKEQSLPVRRVLSLAADALGAEAEGRGMHIVVMGRPHTVRADPALLARVVHNLATNAVRHGEARVVLGARRVDARCVLMVCDRGEGIPKEDQQRIFEDLVRLPKVRDTSAQQGLGLGLSTVKRICQLARWPLRMKTYPGGGTRFEVSIPLAEPHLAAPPSQAMPLPARSDRGDVLLVEPDPLVRRALRNWLESVGWKVISRAGGAQALLAYRKLCREGCPPDIVVTEYWLPEGATGPTLLAQLFKNARTPLAAVLITGDVELSVASIGPVPVLRKPVSGSALHKVLCDVHPRGSGGPALQEPPD